MKRVRSIKAKVEKVVEVLDIVRTLPPTVKLANVWELVIDWNSKDPDEMFSSLAESYGLEDEEGLPYIDEHMENQHYQADLHRAKNHYLRKALVECTSRLPNAFADYVSIPGTSYKEQKKLFEQIVTKRPVSLEEFADFIWTSSTSGPNLEALGLHEAIRRYETAGRFYRQAYELMNVIKSYRQSIKGSFRSSVQRISFASIVEIDFGDSSMTFRADHFATVFEGIDHNRLRLCDHCHRIFWVKRIDKNPEPDKKYGCTPECVTVLTTRKWRERTTEKQRENYKVSRIARQLEQEKK